MQHQATDQGGPPAVALDDVSFAYESIPVLEHASVTIRQGESISIVGPNGGGKTTLLRLILGLLQPDEGRMRVFGDPPHAARLRWATCRSTSATTCSSRSP